NWMRLNSRSRMSASVLIRSVLARPGTPVMRQWPPVNSAIRTCSTTWSWPTMTLRSSARMRSRPSATLSAVAVATSSVGEGINDFVDSHAIRHRRVLDVAGILLDVGPLPAVAHVRVPVEEHHRPAVVVENGAQVRDEPVFLPAAAGEERAEAGHLGIGV